MAVRRPKNTLAIRIDVADFGGSLGFHAPYLIASAQRFYAEPRGGFTFQPRDAQRRAKRGAEAPGQQTPLRRLLRGVGRRDRSLAVHRQLYRIASTTGHFDSY